VEERFVAAKKKAPAKRPVKKSVKKPAAKKSTARASKKSVKRTVKKAATKRTVKKSSASKVDATKIVIPPVPNRPTTSISTTPAPAKGTTPSAPVKKSSSPTVLFLVIAGIVVLAIFALSNSDSDDSAAPKPNASESVEPSPTKSESEGTALAAHEAPVGFVAINNGNGGVTLRWKAPAATEGITGYSISVSYNAKDFTEVTTTASDVYSFDIAMASDEGGTQFLIQTVYSDGTKVDGKKFSLKGKYQ